MRILLRLERPSWRATSTRRSWILGSLLGRRLGAASAALLRPRVPAPSSTTRACRGCPRAWGTLGRRLRPSTSTMTEAGHLQLHGELDPETPAHLLAHGVDEATNVVCRAAWVCLEEVGVLV